MSTRLIRAALGLVGGVGVAVGAAFLFERSHQEVISAAIWFTVPAIFSDLLLLPIAAVTGHLLTKWLAPWARLPAQVAAVLIGTLLLIAVPYLGRPGLRPDNDSLLNRNYVLGYLVFVAVIAGLAVLWALLRRRRVPVGAAGTPRARG